MGPRPEEAGIHPALAGGNGVLGLVPVALAAGGGQNGQLLNIFSRQTVQTGFHPVRFQPGLLLIVHVPEVAAAAELGHRALTVHPMGGFFQQLGNFPRRPGLAHRFDAHQRPLPGDGIGDKHGNALDVGNALPLGGIVRNQGFINLILDEHRPILLRLFSVFSLPLYHISPKG